jgi:hypothetical protein
MRRFLLALHASGWPGFLGALVVVALQLSFHQVVRGAVRQGDLRRELVALHSAAGWRCNAMHDRVGRDSCVARLNATPADPAALRALDAAPPLAALQRLSR